MLRTIIFIILSALAAVISYPQLDLWMLIWIALVPLFFLLEGKSKRQAFGLGFVFGYLFFFGTIGWLVYVTYPGTFLLCAYLALYPAAFALGFVYFNKIPLVPRVFVLASLWTALELIRANFLSGFGWATLGQSQYKNLWIIQIADTIGIYGISFIIVFFNLTVFETIKVLLKKSREEALAVRSLQMIMAGILISCLAYSFWIFKTMTFPSTVKIAVVQPNLLERIKWNPANMSMIVSKYLGLTNETAKENPDVILWPETSLPGVLSDHPSYLQRIQLRALDLNIPIVMGSVIEDNGHYYNSAIFIGRNGTIQGQYNKMHLVPFGEFMPLRPLLGWINAAMELEDFTAGREYTLFTVPDTSHRFGILICFEDTLNDLARNFTKKGAHFLMNMTNDAWFMDTKAPFLHLSGAVFESVQNRRSLVRAANTGVSGFIDPMGRIIKLAQDNSGKKTFVSATAVCDVPVNDHLSFYTKYADIFTYFCFLCILWGVIEQRRKYA